MQVVNYVIYAENPYHRLLYSGILGDYQPIRADVFAAIERLQDNPDQILHIHWEEHAIRHCPTATEARRKRDDLLARIDDFIAQGGTLIWTIHNLLPHEQQHIDLFLEFRRELAARAHRILVHSTHAIEILRSQAPVDPAKLYHLPHPSYLGIYEPEDQAEYNALSAPPSRQLLAFGKLRRYKGFDTLLDKLPEPFLVAHDLRLKILGAPLPGENYLEGLVDRTEIRPRIDVESRRVPDEEVAIVFRQAAALVLPYERFLTSGVALLALSLGLPAIAPATASMKELLPRPAHRFLYEPGSAVDFRRATLAIVDLAIDDRADVVRALLDRARQFHPHRISARLGEVYDRYVTGSPRHRTVT